MIEREIRITNSRLTCSLLIVFLYFSLDLIGGLCGLVLCLIIAICCIANQTSSSSAQKRLAYHGNEMKAEKIKKQQQLQHQFLQQPPSTPRPQQQQQQPFISSQMSASKLRDLFYMNNRNNRNHKRRSTAINRSGKRNSAKLACRTDSPSCLSERRKVVEFSESFEVELHYTLNRPVVSLMCRVSVIHLNTLIFTFLSHNCCGYSKHPLDIQ